MALEIVAEERVGFWGCGFATTRQTFSSYISLFGIEMFIVKECEAKIIKTLRILDACSCRWFYTLKPGQLAIVSHVIKALNS